MGDQGPLLPRAQTHPGSRSGRCPQGRKKGALGLLDEFTRIWHAPASPFRTAPARERAFRLALGLLAYLGRHTVAGMVAATGRQFVDWSADYRLFSRSPWDPRALFDPVLLGTLNLLDPSCPLVVALDDTVVPKTGTAIDGVSLRRDPRSPHFRPNLIPAQRFCQIPALLPDGAGAAGARAIPIRYEHAPSPPKPSRKAPPAQWTSYRQQSRQHSLARQAAALQQALRHTLDARPAGRARTLVTTVDGSFCNATMLRQLPERTVLIGRVRHDATLFALPATQPTRGRRRSYGTPLPTPEALRGDESVPWTAVQAWAAGRIHTFLVKHCGPLLWPKAGPRQPLQLVVIRPLHYRVRPTSRLLYRRPAYLICTDAELPLAQLLQYYLWRWDIEVNHRDEKQLVGVGQAQVRSRHAVERVPAFAVAAYATLLLAAARTERAAGSLPSLPPPKWRRLRRPTHRGHEFERTRTLIRGNVDTISSQRGQFGRLLGAVSAMLGRVSTIVGALSTIVGLRLAPCPV